MDLIGTKVTDIVKVGIAYGAAMATASVIGAGGVAVFALGSLAVVLIVGFLVTGIFTHLDEHYGITDKLIVSLRWWCL